tara:strand:- start:1495 stop:1875 length:381 start_codon:yes stop_codon:yes gene_type:complete
MGPHKEDWDFYRSYDRSRSSSPEPSVRHLEVVEEMVFDYPHCWKTKKYYVCIFPFDGSKRYITEEQKQEINKMKLKQDAEMKKILREVDDDYVLKNDEEWVTEEDIKKMEEEFADALDDFIMSLIK